HGQERVGVARPRHRGKPSPRQRVIQHPGIIGIFLRVDGIGGFDFVPKLALGEMPQHFPRRLVMHCKSPYGEIDDVIWAHRSVHIRRRLPPGAPVALEGCDNLHIRRPRRDGLSYHTHKNQDNEIPHHVILLQLTPALTDRDHNQLSLARQNSAGMEFAYWDMVASFRTTTSTGLDGRMLPLPSVPSTEKAW